MLKRKIEFFKHNISSQDINECVKILRSIFLTTGSKTLDFEKEFASYLEIKYAVGLTSCTDALFLGLKYYGIGPGDEVITTPLSFVSTANVIEHCGAKPVFADVESSTGNIDATSISQRITKKTKAIIPVHLYGHMCNMKEIRRLADKFGLKIIEDSAHCIEGIRDGIRPGELGDIACFSFYATKTITSGEGGAIATNNKSIYNWLIQARLHGINKNAADRYTKLYQHYDMDFLGYKANMTNIQASLLIGQLGKIDYLWKKREKITQKYDQAFKNNLYIKTPQVLPGTKTARYIYTIWVNPKKRDKYLHQFQNSQIGVAINFRPIHLMKYYRNKYGYKPGDLPYAEAIGASTITIPLYPKLTPKEVKYITKTINQVVKA